jgi:type III secretory pathway component EscU
MKGDVKKKPLTYWTKVLQLKLIYIVNTVHQILRYLMLILLVMYLCVSGIDFVFSSFYSNIQNRTVELF